MKKGTTERIIIQSKTNKQEKDKGVSHFELSLGLSPQYSSSLLNWFQTNDPSRISSERERQRERKRERVCVRERERENTKSGNRPTYTQK